jgi:hypothetical protein
MQLALTDHQLTVHLDWQERLWAFHLSATIPIPLEQITQVSTERPEFTWRTIRAPGTAIPGAFAAGTFYTPNGREFWYLTGDRDYLVLHTPTDYYKRVVLTLEDNTTWADRIRTKLSKS